MESKLNTPINVSSRIVDFIVHEFPRSVEGEGSCLGSQIVQDQADYIDGSQRISGMVRNGVDSGDRYGARSLHLELRIILRANVRAWHQAERSYFLAHAIFIHFHLSRFDFLDQAPMRISDAHFEQHFARRAANNNVRIGSGLLRHAGSQQRECRQDGCDPHEDDYFIAMVYFRLRWTERRPC